MPPRTRLRRSHPATVELRQRETSSHKAPASPEYDVRREVSPDPSATRGTLTGRAPGATKARALAYTAGGTVAGAAVTWGVLNRPGGGDDGAGGDDGGGSGPGTGESPEGTGNNGTPGKRPMATADFAKGGLVGAIVGGIAGFLKGAGFNGEDAEAAAVGLFWLAVLALVFLIAREVKS